MLDRQFVKEAVVETAYIHTNFKKGFLLNEEALVKIDDIIRKRLASTAAGDIDIIYDVYREDGVHFVLHRPLEVGAEENSSRNAIKRLQITAELEETQISLTFDKAAKTALIINSSSRDTGYLLYSDVKDYLVAEVLTRHSFDGNSVFLTRVLPLLAAGIVPLLVLDMAISPPDMVAVNRALHSVDISEKLNYIIQDMARRQSSSSFRLFLWLPLLAIPPLFGISPAIKWLYPRNIFAWGKSGEAYQHRVEVREKIWWGVVIATIVSVISTLLLDYAKKHA